MEYVRLSDSTAQSLFAIRGQHPHTSIPEGADLLDMGYAPLSAIEPPTFDPLTQSVIRDGCELVDGVWQYKWRIDPLSAEQIAAKQAAAAVTLRDTDKAHRTAAVAAIKVTTAAGNTFDGDEISQGRMARAILGLSTGLAPSVSWVLADNSVIQATARELTEALVLAGQAQAAMWVI